MERKVQPATAKIIQFCDGQTEKYRKVIGGTFTLCNESLPNVIVNVCDILHISK